MFYFAFKKYLLKCLCPVFNFELNSFHVFFFSLLHLLCVFILIYFQSDVTVALRSCRKLTELICEFVCIFVCIFVCVRACGVRISVMKYGDGTAGWVLSKS